MKKAKIFELVDDLCDVVDLIPDDYFHAKDELTELCNLILAGRGNLDAQIKRLVMLLKGAREIHWAADYVRQLRDAMEDDGVQVDRVKSKKVTRPRGRKPIRLTCPPCLRAKKALSMKKA